MIQGDGFTINESKFDYFFGRVRSTPRNAQRSLDNLETLKKLGIDEASGGREKLMEIFQQGLTAPEVPEYRKNNEYGTSIARKVEISGLEVLGAIVISYFYPDSDLSAIPQVASIIALMYKED